MQRFLPYPLYALALLALYQCLVNLLLLLAGERVEARVTRVALGEMKAEQGTRGASPGRNNTFYRVDAEVAYTFDVLPKPVEALQRLSGEPLHKGVQGNDVLKLKVRKPGATPVEEGEALRVRYLRFFPKLNRAEQLYSLRVEAAVSGFGGLVLLGLTGWIHRQLHRRRLRAPGPVPPGPREAV